MQETGAPKTGNRAAIYSCLQLSGRQKHPISLRNDTRLGTQPGEEGQSLGQGFLGLEGWVRGAQAKGKLRSSRGGHFDSRELHLSRPLKLALPPTTPNEFPFQGGDR